MKAPAISVSELDEFRRSLRRFVERELMPFERRAMSAADRVAVQQKAKDAGFWMLAVPEELGGQGLGLSGMAVFWHEISRTTAVPARDHSLFGPVPGPILLSLHRHAETALSRSRARRPKGRLFRADGTGRRSRSGVDAHQRRAKGSGLRHQRRQNVSLPTRTKPTSPSSWR